MSGLTFSCPVCGADVPRQAKSCPDCGACEKSGWGGDLYLDGIDLPEDDFSERRELGNGSRKSAGRAQWMQRFWMVVALLVLLAMAWMMVRGAL